MKGNRISKTLHTPLNLSTIIIQNSNQKITLNLFEKRGWQWGWWGTPTMLKLS